MNKFPLHWLMPILAVIAVAVFTVTIMRPEWFTEGEQQLALLGGF